MSVLPPGNQPELVESIRKRMTPGGELCHVWLRLLALARQGRGCDNPIGLFHPEPPRGVMSPGLMVQDGARQTILPR